MLQSLTMNSFLKEERQMNAWESVFMQSRVNDGYYDEDRLPEHAWQWPQATWFRGRLYKVREEQSMASLNSLRRIVSKAKVPAELDLRTH
jgi:hypothetical protein